MIDVEKTRARNRRYYSRHIDKERIRSRKKAALKTVEDWRENRRRQRNSASPNYIAQLLQLPLGMIPEEIIQLKRSALLLKRELGITNKTK